MTDKIERHKHESRKLKDLKRELGLSDREIGEALNVDTRTVRRWMADPDRTDTARPPNPIALRVLDYFLKRGGIPEDWPYET